MGRIRTNVINELESESEMPMVIKKEEKEEETNGIIPVLYEDVKVYYDSHEHTYFAAIKIEGKKHRFEMVK
jgi:hypothetical protein